MMSIEAIKRVEKAIEDIKHGKMVIMMDDEDRENEGDLVYAATFSTPDMVNFRSTSWQKRPEVLSVHLSPMRSLPSLILYPW